MTPSQEAIKLGLDPYAVLGVANDADERAIKRAWRAAAKKTHPDHNPDNPQAEEIFKRANLAFQILGDPDERRRYDTRSGAEAYFYSPQAPGSRRATHHRGFAEDWIRRNQAETERRRQAQREKLEAALVSSCYLWGLCDWMVDGGLMSRRGPSPWGQEWGHRVASDAQVRAIGNLWWVLERQENAIPRPHWEALSQARAHARFIKRAAASDLITLLLTLRDVPWPTGVPSPRWLRQGGAR